MKAIKIFDNKSNYPRIEINYSNLQDNFTKKATDDKPKALRENDLIMFIGSFSFVKVNEVAYWIFRTRFDVL